MSVAPGSVDAVGRPLRRLYPAGGSEQRGGLERGQVVVDGGVTLDGQTLPVGVAQHLFVSAIDDDLTPLEAASLT